MFHVLSKKFSSREADGWLPFSALPCEETMKHYNSSPRLNNQTANHGRERSNRKGLWLSTLGLRFSLRDYAFCMATLLLFCLGSLFYQLNGGPPKVLLEIRQYLGKCFLCSTSPRPTFQLCRRGTCWILWAIRASCWSDVLGQVWCCACSPLRAHLYAAQERVSRAVSVSWRRVYSSHSVVMQLLCLRWLSVSCALWRKVEARAGSVSKQTHAASLLPQRNQHILSTVLRCSVNWNRGKKEKTK